ncbi:heavy-metal-associated domain-containing protein [Maribellus sediminis]|uniref:heavy-metal-associated domain-containing protein n=1 Tax=Maribellus sediminis TaxID=2696285 RepID=UPI001430008E|nr:heavy metal-associated domain-containing protein [Maribellus sediminis]
MKKLLIIAVALLIGVAANPLYAQKKENKVVCFKSNMDCSNCEQTISDYLKFEKGVKDLKVDHVTNTIKVEYNDGKNTDEGLAKAIEKKGYKAEKISTGEYEKIVAASAHGHEHGSEQHKDRTQN